MVKRDIPYYIIFSVVMIGFLILLKNRNTSPDDPCELQSQLFSKEITSGLVAEKFIEKENHALKKVVIKDKDRTYEVLFIPYDNWVDFEKINIGDSISKPPKSFHFIINNGYEFQLKFDCDYK